MLRARSGRAGSIVISLRVIPGVLAATEGVFRIAPIEGYVGTAVRVSARAVDGAAIDAVLASLANVLGVPKRRLTLVGGAKSRTKTFALEAEGGVEAAALTSVQQVLDALPER